jgi:aflatoxin B1 aldehyde reductase
MKDINLVLGTMTFGESVFTSEISKFLHAFLDAGYDEIDTAYVYNNGASESLLGDVLPKLTKPIKVATKVNPRISGKLDGNAAYKQVNESLVRMRLSYVDIVYLHFPDPHTPINSILEACNCLHKQGKVKELGVSNFPAWMVSESWHLCEKHGWIKPTVYEGIYNPLTRKAETELNSCLNNYNMRFYAYNPLAGGLLTAKHALYEDSPADGRFTHRPNYKQRYWKESYFNAIEHIKATTEPYGISIAEATYRWLVNHSMLNNNRGDAVIIGASKLDHLIQNIKSVKAGPLPLDVIEAYEYAWNMCKAESPEYFSLYKG